ncbi:hypothetical protein [Mesorhizobium sp. WSM4884]|uniref:hypothetical protein n=1 Tax=Mesorhizobium sp. WSM4884 TaxID=3038542 RepID=UPI002416AAD3|nr:hypothetical protein [Mesorhizobium sp. WSM4884]MDG4880215.1 hypothetical protein [Mesorhizobium sp. WSM4884]
MDPLRIYLEAKRWADSVAPPPRYNPLLAGALGATIAGGVVAFFCWLVGSSHMTGATIVTMILAFALPYFHLRSKDSNNAGAFASVFSILLELERKRETGPPETSAEK